jgi:hypothetical protein
MNWFFVILFGQILIALEGHAQYQEAVDLKGGDYERLLCDFRFQNCRINEAHRWNGGGKEGPRNGPLRLVWKNNQKN